MVSVVSGCNFVQCTKCQRWAHCRCPDVPRQVSLSYRDAFLCRTCLGHNCSVEEKLEFKRGEDVLEKVEKFCYLGDMISCYGGACESVSARIGMREKDQGVKWCVSREAGYIFESTGEDLPVL